MNRCCAVLISLISFTVLLHSFADAANEPAPTVAPQLTDEHDIIFPRHLTRNDGIRAGHALVRLKVDAKGLASDFICIEASHPEFCRAVDAALHRAPLRPAVIDGIPTAVVSSLKVKFKAHGGRAVVVTTMENIQSTLDPLVSKSPEGFSLTKPKLLDRPLKIAVRPTPYAVMDTNDKPIAGIVEVEFYIDRDGTIKLPLVRKASDDRLIDAAINTLREVRFEPPISEGRAVPVFAVQAFRFGSE